MSDLQFIILVALLLAQLFYNLLVGRLLCAVTELIILIGKNNTGTTPAINNSDTTTKTQ